MVSRSGRRRRSIGIPGGGGQGLYPGGWVCESSFGWTLKTGNCVNGRTLSQGWEINSAKLGSSMTERTNDAANMSGRRPWARRLRIGLIALGLFLCGVAGLGGLYLAVNSSEVSEGTLSVHCKDLKTQVLVDTESKRMFLCSEGRADGIYKVALGKRGVGKRRKGDKKTPLGKYWLGNPRPSNAGVRTFIQVGYPTLVQQQKGYTGGSIGIHGPSRDGRLRSTLGCIAVATHDEIDEIEMWVKENRVKKVWIRG